MSENEDCILLNCLCHVLQSLADDMQAGPRTAEQECLSGWKASEGKQKEKLQHLTGP